MRIAVVTPTFLPIIGGAELGIHEIYRRIGQRHDVHIVTVSPAERSVREYAAVDYADDAYTVHRAVSVTESLARSFPVRAVKQTSLPYVLQLRRLHKRLPFDVANLHYIHPYFGAAAYLRQVLDRPVVTSLVARSDVVRLLPAYKRAYAHLVSRQTDIAVANSTYYLRRSGFGRKVEVIPYGVDTQEFSPNLRSADGRCKLGLGPDDVGLLAVQRLAPIKRVDVLLDVLASIAEHRQNVKLIVAGKGSEEASLVQQAAERGLDDNVRFLGYVASADLPSVFACSDIYVSHSMFETFGIVFAQAMAAGLPVVAASTSCVPDVLTSANGHLVRPFDVGGFRDAVEHLADNPAARSEIGRQNRRQAVERLDWDTIAGAYEDVLAEASETYAAPARSA
jgi:glycosyltransferase involved in cell wall biosynthesis